ncbi:MAG TPA: hypothetical protein VJR89_02780, partial [Polyangiales bacterium]|nr:hypothetical protein [Polyangiales bacterium]
MEQPTNRSLSLFVGLLSSAIAACSGGGQGGLVTVGVRPTDVVAASGGTGSLPMPGSDVMTQIPDGNSTIPTGLAEPAGSAASAGSEATVR